MAEIDASELYKLASDIGQAPVNAGPNLIAAVSRTAHKATMDWRERVRGAKSLPHLARKISYTVEATAGLSQSTIEAEIGPTRGGQGSLGAIHEFGSPTSPAHGDGLAALHENEADFERGIVAAIDDALKAAGL